MIRGIYNRANVLCKCPGLASLFCRKDILIWFIVFIHILVQVIFTSAGGKNNFIFVFIKHRRVVLKFGIDFPSDVYDGKISWRCNKFLSILTFKDSAVNSWQIYFILPLIIGFSSQLLFIAVVKIQSFVKFLSVLITSTDQIFDVKTIRGILTINTHEIFNCTVLPHRQQVHASSLVVSFDEC